MLETVEALRPLIERAAAANEEATEIAPEVAHALEEAGIAF